MIQQGVIVGCDRQQEWLLSWWWNHYSSHNTLPVAFANFGMSERALAWCKEKGTCLTLPTANIRNKDEICPLKQKNWETRHGKSVWCFRNAWFKKPLALLHSPFSSAIWFDLDCQINGPLDALFPVLALGAEIALVREPDYIQNQDQKCGYLLPKEVCYNSGVIVFRNNADILHRWWEEASIRNADYAGDQQALSRAIFKYRPKLLELPSSCNWLQVLDSNSEALVHHFAGGDGKLELLKRIHPSLISEIDDLRAEK